MATHPYILIALSVAATILASLQAFLEFSKRSDVHRTVGRRYGELKKENEYLVYFETYNENLTDRINEIREKEANISVESPNTLESSWEQAKRETADDNEEFSVRNRNLSYIEREYSDNDYRDHSRY